MPTVNRPLVTVILAYYNGQKYVEEAIKSVYAQTYENIELIVVDDCSSDIGAREYIKKLAERYKFKLLINEENVGAIRAVANAFVLAAGDYISLMAQDDLYLPERIEHLIKLIQNEDLDVVYCNGAYFHDNNQDKYKIFDDAAVVSAQKCGQNAVVEMLLSKDTIGCLLMQGALFSRKFFAETLPFRRVFMIDDWPLTIIAWRDYKVRYDSQLVYLYRLHSDNIHKNYWKWLPGRFQVISELVPAKERWNTAANILADVGNVVLNNGEKELGYRILAASLLLTENKNTISLIERFLIQTQKQLSNEEKKRCSTAVRRIVNQASWGRKLRYKAVKLMINMVPVKKWRKNLKTRFL